LRDEVGVLTAREAAYAIAAGQECFDDIAAQESAGAGDEGVHLGLLSVC
jgi:hypothetical protein